MKLLITPAAPYFLGVTLLSTRWSVDMRITLFNRGKHNPDLFPGGERRFMVIATAA